MTRSYYSANVSDFLQADETNIFGHLSKQHNHDLEALQKNAWTKQIKILKSALKDFGAGQIYFEFSIPRMTCRCRLCLVRRFR